MFPPLMCNLCSVISFLQVPPGTLARLWPGCAWDIAASRPNYGTWQSKPCPFVVLTTAYKSVFNKVNMHGYIMGYGAGFLLNDAPLTDIDRDWKLLCAMSDKTRTKTFCSMEWALISCVSLLQWSIHSKVTPALNISTLSQQTMRINCAKKQNWYGLKGKTLPLTWPWPVLLSPSWFSSLQCSYGRHGHTSSGPDGGMEEDSQPAGQRPRQRQVLFEVMHFTDTNKHDWMMIVIEYVVFYRIQAVSPGDKKEILRHHETPEKGQERWGRILPCPIG